MHVALRFVDGAMKKRPTRVFLHLVLSGVLWHHAHAAAVVRGAGTGTGTSVQVPLTAPPNAEALLSTHVSLSIEQDRWPEWVGVSAPNGFTLNALENLQQITGTPPKIRVGANSEDRTRWSAGVTVSQAAFPPYSAVTPYPEATALTVGDGFYQLSKRLPRGTRMTWGVNLGLDSAANAADMARSIVRAFDTPDVRNAGVSLDFIEVGNEADLFRKHGLRSGGYSEKQYVADWNSIAGPVAQAAGLLAPGATVKLQGAAFAGQGFTIKGIISDGILTSTPGKAIKQMSQHHYSAAFCKGGSFALSSFMNKQAIRGNLTLFTADIAASRANGLPYVLGETNSIACHGAPGVSNTAGAALWAIDYTLQAATLGIAETYFHQGVGFKYNFIQPVPLARSILDGTPISPPTPAHVQPPYYAAVLVAHAAGRTGRARVVELGVPHGHVSGYAVYEPAGTGTGGEVLVRAVFVNLDAWLAGAGGARPRVHVDLGIAGVGGGRMTTARVWRLAMGRADDVGGLTFGGVSYETPDGRGRGVQMNETIVVADGVDVASSEAVLIMF